MVRDRSFSVHRQINCHDCVGLGVDLDLRWNQYNSDFEIWDSRFGYTTSIHRKSGPHPLQLVRSSLIKLCCWLSQLSRQITVYSAHTNIRMTFMEWGPDSLTKLIRQSYQIRVRKIGFTWWDCMITLVCWPMLIGFADDGNELIPLLLSKNSIHKSNKKCCFCWKAHHVCWFILSANTVSLFVEQIDNNVGQMISSKCFAGCWNISPPAMAN